MKLIQKNNQGSQREIVVNFAELPATIGRGKNVSYRINENNFPKQIYQSLSRIQATIYREGESVFLKDGSMRPSSHGCYFKGQRISNPIQLYEGIEVDLLSLQGHRIYLAWVSSRSNQIEEFPTIEVERENLKIELSEAEVRIADLQAAIGEFALQLTSLREDLQGQQNINLRQDLHLRRIRSLLIGLGAIGLAGAWLLLGQDTGKLEELLGVALLILSLGSGGYAALKPNG